MAIIQDDYLLGGQRLPLMQGLDWKIVTTRYTKKSIPQLLDPQKDITLRWVKDTHAADLYVKGMDTPTLLKHLGLTLSLKKGVFVLSKRLSRIMRPFFFWDFPATLDVYHDPTLDKVDFDGIGWIRRDVLSSLLKNIPIAKADKLTKKLLESNRLELTLVGPWGEDKGHVFVVDELDHDIVLADDSKTEVRSERIMLAVKPVRSKDYRYIDVQSVINLHPFMREEHYRPWLEAEADKFLAQLKDGKWKQLASRLSETQREGWWIMDYLSKGYRVDWFQGAMKTLGNIHHVKVYARGFQNMRLPIPGAFYYMALDKHMGWSIPQGSITLDRKSATAFFSIKDWRWLREKWGGADFDDFLTLLGFTDYDGQRKVLAWRSPNEVGQWALLNPFGEFPKTWTWPTLDSRELPAEPNTNYLHLIDKPEIFDTAYSIESMSSGILSANANKGEPGGSVNFHMVYKAMMGLKPETLPATVEEIMDAVAKLGSLLTRVKDWNRAAASEFVLKHPQIPRSMVRRLWGMLSDEAKDAVDATDDHWIENLRRMVLTHLESYDLRLDELAKTAKPPISVLAYGKDYLEQSGKIRIAFSKAFDESKPVKDEAEWNTIKAAVEKAFREYPFDQWTHIMAAIALRIYVMGETVGSDAIMWQIGQSILNEKGVSIGRKRGMVHVTLKMLEEVNPTDDRGETLLVRGAWFSIAKELRKQQGKSDPQHMGELSKPDRDNIKAKVSEWADAGRFNDLLTIKHVEENGEQRALVFRNGHLLGYVQRGQEGRIGETFRAVFTKAYDGNLHMVIKEE